MKNKILIAILVSLSFGVFTACEQKSKEYLYDGMAIVSVKLSNNEYGTSFDKRMWVYPKNGNLEKRICVKIDDDYIISLENVGNLSAFNNEKFTANFTSGNIGFSQKIGLYCSEEAKGTITFIDGKVLNIRTKENIPLNVPNEGEVETSLLRYAGIMGNIVITKKSDPDFKKTLRIDEPIKIKIIDENSFDEFHYSNSYASF